MMKLTEDERREMKEGLLSFLMPCPKEPAAVVPAKLPKAPNRQELRFQPRLNFMCRLFGSKRKKAEKEAEEAYQKACNSWEEACNNTTLNNECMRMEYKRAMDVYRNDLAIWHMKKTTYLKKQEESELG